MPPWEPFCAKCQFWKLLVPRAFFVKHRDTENSEKLLSSFRRQKGRSCCTARKTVGGAGSSSGSWGTRGFEWCCRRDRQDFSWGRFGRRVGGSGWWWRWQGTWFESRSLQYCFQVKAEPVKTEAVAEEHNESMGLDVHAGEDDLSKEVKDETVKTESLEVFYLVFSLLISGLRSRKTNANWERWHSWQLTRARTTTHQEGFLIEKFCVLYRWKI